MGDHGEHVEHKPKWGLEWSPQRGPWAELLVGDHGGEEAENFLSNSAQKGPKGPTVKDVN